MKILDILAENNITNYDRENYIDNDQGLYDWWVKTRLSKHKFIKQYKDEIDDIITNVLNAGPEIYNPINDGNMKL